MAKFAQYRRVKKVGIVTLLHEPVNGLSAQMCEAIDGRINDAMADDDCTSIVIRVRGDDFAVPLPMNAKANIPLRDLTEKIENCPKPVVVALKGAVRGGALELALAAHYRVMQVAGSVLMMRDAIIGLPPVAGGLQRLATWSGVAIALQMAVDLTPHGARAALAINLIDALCDGDVNDEAFAFATLLEPDAARPAAGYRRKDIDFARDHALLQRYRARHDDGVHAHIIDCIEAATLLPYEAGLLRGYDAHDACFNKPEHLALAAFARVSAGFGDDENARNGVSARLRDAIIRAGDIAVALGARPDTVDKAVHGMGFVRGIYDELSPDARAQIDAALRERKAKPAPIATIESRIIAALANEVMRLMETGIVQTPEQVDVMLVRAGDVNKRFAGPMRRAADLGAMAIRAELVRNARLGEPDFWAPHPMWDALVRDDRSFADMRAPEQS